MKTIVLLLLLMFAALLPGRAQEAARAGRLVQEGRELQQTGRYHKALKKFDQALREDPASLEALSEKAFMLLALQHYREALAAADQALREHPGSKHLQQAYLTRATALDYLNRPNLALKAFDEGLRAYPNSLLLHLNKGITLANLNRLDEAQASLEQAVRAQPTDPNPDPHLAIARLADSRQQRVPALMAFCRFLVLEPEGRRARQALKQVHRLMQQGASRKGSRSLTITIDRSLLPDSARPGYPNDFRNPELALTLAAAVKLSRQGKDLPEAEQFVLRFGAFCSALRDNLPEGTGFFWEFYAPYYAELYEVRMVQPFAYVIHASTRKKHVKKWLAQNERELSRFFAWTDIYPWHQYK